MGKGYNNYMCKKPFHPGSKANIKRAWMAEQKTENDKRKQEELKAQYEKEQNLYNNRVLISSESKDKLELNFMYEAPPGAKRERQKEDDEPEFKFEWQRKYNAPREDYAKGNEDIKDQPFGIPVRNVRCIKCHKWGHINTDRECPLYNQASTSSMPSTSMDPLELMRQMKEDGFGLKENVLGHQLNPGAANQQFIPSDDESDPEIDFLKSLSAAEKKKLLKKLKKLSKKQEKSSNCKKKKKSKKTKKHKSRASSSDSEEEKKTKKKKSRKPSPSSTDSDSSSAESEDESQIKTSKREEANEKYPKSEKRDSKVYKNVQESVIHIRKSSEHRSQEKSNRRTVEENQNADRYTSNKGISHRNMRDDSRQSSDYNKHRTKDIRNKSHDKFGKETQNSSLDRYASKEDITHKKVKSDSKKETYDYNKHKTKDEKYDQKKFTNLKTKKEEDSSSDSEEEKYKNKRIKKKIRDSSNDSGEEKYKKKRTEKKVRDSRNDSEEEKYLPIRAVANLDVNIEKKVKHSSNTKEKDKTYSDEKTENKLKLSVEEQHQASKTETNPKDSSHASKRKSETLLCKEDSEVDNYNSKEKVTHKNIKSEPRQDSSDDSKLKSKEIKLDESETEKGMKQYNSHCDQEKHTAMDSKKLDDDDLNVLKRKVERSEDNSNNNSKKGKYDHPDGFSHLCPQAHIKANYLQPDEEYEGNIHDGFRHQNREMRSPSVKHKYNK